MAQAQRLVRVDDGIECSVKNGGSSLNAAKLEVPNDESWEYTLIGSRNAWIEEIEVPDHLKQYLARGAQRTQVYQGEDVCIDGSKRTTVVLFECGREEQGGTVPRGGEARA